MTNGLKLFSTSLHKIYDIVCSYTLRKNFTCEIFHFLNKSYLTFNLKRILRILLANNEEEKVWHVCQGYLLQLDMMFYEKSNKYCEKDFSNTTSAL